MRKISSRALTSFEFLVSVCLLASMAGCGCPDEGVSLRIGAFHSRDAALRAAIPRLADAINSCPRVKTYRVGFTAPGIEGVVDRHALLYRRRSDPYAWIGYEDDYLSGISAGFGPYEVVDSDVQSVAEKGGSLEDFVQLDRARK